MHSLFKNVDGKRIKLTASEGAATRAEWSRGPEDSSEHIVKSINEGLSKTDWAVLPDADLSEADKVKWLQYRRALRDMDVTARLRSEISWPIKPDELGRSKR